MSQIEMKIACFLGIVIVEVLALSLSLFTFTYLSTALQGSFSVRLLTNTQR